MIRIIKFNIIKKKNVNQSEVESVIQGKDIIVSDNDDIVLATKDKVNKAVKSKNLL